MIYFIHNLTNKTVKIGFSINPASRFKTLQTATADRLELMGTIVGDKQLEERLHVRFAKVHVRGEWFSARPKFLRAVARLIRGPAVAPERRRHMLEGMSFHSRDADGQVDWQGEIDQVQGDLVKVRTFSWLDGMSFTRRVVPLAEVLKWDLYDSAEEATSAYEARHPSF